MDNEVKDWCIGKENETQHSKAGAERFTRLRRAVAQGKKN
jgi:hypothetical protein